MIGTIYTSDRYLNPTHHSFTYDIHTIRYKTPLIIADGQHISPVHLQRNHILVLFIAALSPLETNSFPFEMIFLPSKPLLQKIHLSLSLPLPNRLSHIIPQPTRSTHANSHRPNLLSTFHFHQSLHIRFSREHLHRRTRAMDLLAIPWPRYE